MKKFKLGLVGAGFGWRVLRPAFERTGSFVVTGVWSRRAREEFKGVQVFQDWESLIRAPYIDALVVATPPFLQSQILRAAARWKKPVFFEKPLAADFAAARTAVQALKKARVPAMIDFEFTELPVWKEFKRRVQSGGIGTLSAIAVTWEAELPKFSGRSWKDSAQKGGGLLLNFGSHVVDYLEDLGGKITRVKTQENKPDSVQFRFDSKSISGAVRLHRAPGLTHRHEVLAVGTSGFLIFRNTTRDYMKGFTLEGMARSEQRVFFEDPSDRRSSEDGRVEAVRRMAGLFASRLRRKNTRPDYLARAFRSSLLLDRVEKSQGTWTRV